MSVLGFELEVLFEVAPAAILVAGASILDECAQRGLWFMQLSMEVEQSDAVAVAALRPSGGHLLFGVDPASLWDATHGSYTIRVLGIRESSP